MKFYLMEKFRLLSYKLRDGFCPFEVVTPLNMYQITPRLSLKGPYFFNECATSDVYLEIGLY